MSVELPPDTEEPEELFTEESFQEELPQPEQDELEVSEYAPETEAYQPEQDDTTIETADEPQPVTEETVPDDIEEVEELDEIEDLETDETLEDEIPQDDFIVDLSPALSPASDSVESAESVDSVEDLEEEPEELFTEESFQEELPQPEQDEPEVSEYAPETEAYQPEQDDTTTEAADEPQPVTEETVPDDIEEIEELGELEDLNSESFQDEDLSEYTDTAAADESSFLYNDKAVFSDNALKEALADDDDDENWIADFNMLSERFSKISNGFELPAEIFSTAKDFFNIKSGLFLIYENSSGYFIPFSSVGIDETSLRRCRISMDILKENTLVFNGSQIHKLINKNFLKDFLSRRLWDSIENLTQLIFSYHDNIFGLLYIFNSAVINSSDFDDAASRFIRYSSEAFARSRTSVINNLSSDFSAPPLKTSEALDVICQDLEQEKEDGKLPEHIQITVIKYDNIISALKEIDSDIDEYIVERDIFKIYSSMIGNNGYIRKIAGNIIFLAFFSNLRPINTSILKNQLKTSLVSIFEKKYFINTPNINIVELVPGSDSFKDDLRNFLKSLI